MLIEIYKALCFAVATFFIVLGGMLFFPGNALPWICYAALLGVIEMFVVGLVLPGRKTSGTGAFDSVSGHAAAVLACATFCWPSWTLATYTLVVILAAQFMPGMRSRAFVFGAAASAAAILEVSIDVPSHGWVYATICWSLCVVLAGAAALQGTKAT